MTAEKITLSSLKKGETAQIVSIRTGRAMRQKLAELGMTKGTRVECLYESIWGDPVAYRFCGTVAAIRRSDGAQIFAERCGE